MCGLLALQPELLDRRDDEGYTPLHLAVIAGNRPVIKLLLKLGAKVNMVENDSHLLPQWTIGKFFFSVI